MSEEITFDAARSAVRIALQQWKAGVHSGRGPLGESVLSWNFPSGADHKFYGHLAPGEVSRTCGDAVSKVHATFRVPIRLFVACPDFGMPSNKDAEIYVTFFKDGNVSVEQHGDLKAAPPE